jgi:hypothetical protein
MKHSTYSGQDINASTSNNYSAELKLWVAVLETTIHDYTLGATQGRKGGLNYTTAAMWIFAINQTAKNSFDNICHLCNLNPDSIRRKIKKEPLTVLRRLSNKNYEAIGE